MCWSWGNIDWSATAAWAQAILSAAGIVVGGYIASKVAGRPMLSSRHQRLAALLEIVTAGTELLKLARTQTEAYDDGTLSVVRTPREWERASAAIAGIALLDVSPGSLVGGLINLREDLIFAREAMVHLRRAVRGGAPATRYMGRLLQPKIEAAEQLTQATLSATMEAARAERDWWRP